MTQIHKFGQVTLVCHAFNSDSTEMAVSMKSNDVFIFKAPSKGSNKFALLHRLQQHTSTVLSIDWAPKSDRIVSCSADRNAYVWSRNGTSWIHELVILQFTRAATFTRWSPMENKFATGSGSKVISVCCFETETKFWVSSQIKKGINSTVTCLDWHPENSVIACGSTDLTVRVYGARLKNEGADDGKTNWGTSSKLNTLLWENTEKCGWIHSVSFSADGNRLLWCTHGSTIGMATVTDPSQAPVVTNMLLEGSPFLTLTWIAPNTAVGGGHDCAPYVFNVSTSEIKLGETLDSQDTTDSNRELTARDKFKMIDRTATSDQSGGPLTSKHQNAINEIRVMRGDKAGAAIVSTIGRDGLLIFWDLKVLQQKMKTLKIN